LFRLLESLPDTSDLWSFLTDQEAGMFSLETRQCVDWFFMTLIGRTTTVALATRGKPGQQSTGSLGALTLSAVSLGRHQLMLLVLMAKINKIMYSFQRKFIVQLSGAPGSGKSTISHLLDPALTRW
jgi:hypothetical protein